MDQRILWQPDRPTRCYCRLLFAVLGCRSRRKPERCLWSLVLRNLSEVKSQYCFFQTNVSTSMRSWLKVFYQKT